MASGTCSMQLSNDFGLSKIKKQSQNLTGIYRHSFLATNSYHLSSLALRQNNWSTHLFPERRLLLQRTHNAPCRYNQFRCGSFFNAGQSVDISCVKNAAIALTRSCNRLQSSPLVVKLLPAIGLVVFTIWGLGPVMRQSRNILLRKSDSSWGKSSTHHIMTSYIQPLLLWAGALLVCRVLEPVALPTEASQVVKQRLLNFIRSLSTVLAFAYCLSSVIQQAQKFFMETNDHADARNMGFQFAGKAVYTAVWVAAVSLFMELLGFSTQKWLTAGGLGTVLLTLAGREIFTNFLSSAMIHATRPFVVNEWIQTRIEGYEVSGTVEHVGWWSPTIVRGEDREAVHIPNHKFTVNVVRNLTQKTHWRIKTHLAISHLDVNKINNIVADMRKVLSKNPQVEQQKLHRRVFLDNINPENQALLILVSCFVKTSHFEEYLCVKEAIMLDLLRVIRHHRARLATPIRTIQKIYSDQNVDNIPYSDSASSRPLLLIEPPYKVNGEDRTKSQARQTRVNGDEDNRTAVRPTPEHKVDSRSVSATASDTKGKESSPSDSKAKEISKLDVRAVSVAGPMSDADSSKDDKVAKSASDPKLKVTAKSMSTSDSRADIKASHALSSDTKDSTNGSASKITNSNQPKKVAQGNTRVGHDVSSSQDSLPKIKPGNVSSTSPSKGDVDKASHPPSSKPTLEENIVLGVALDGSKRTLPIEDEISSPGTQAEAKELATCHSTNGSSSSEKDKIRGPHSKIPSSATGDQLDLEG